MEYLNIYNRLFQIIFLAFFVCNPATPQKQVSIDRAKLEQDRIKKENAKKKAEAINTISKTTKKITKQYKSNKIASTKIKSTSYNKNNISSSAKSNSSSNNKKNTILSVNNSTFNVSANGSSKTVTVYTNENWYISLNPASWVHASKNGNYINLTIDKNNSNSERTDYFVIQAGEKTQRITIKQEGSVESYLDISKTNVSFYSSGGTETFIVSCNSDWEIKTETYSWGHLTRSGNTLFLRVDANSSTSSRNDFFVIKSGHIEKKVTITQNGSNSNYSSSSNSSYNTNHNSYNYNKYKKENWWKNRVSFGWNISSLDFNSENLSWKTGVRLRFGKHSDLFNFIVGCDYSLQRVYVNGEMYYVSYDNYTNVWGDLGYYDYTESEWKTAHHEIFIPIELRLNIANCGTNAKWYIGTGFDIGLRVKTGDVYSNGTTYAIDPQFGIMWKHFDLGVDCRIYLNNNISYKNDYKTRFGFYGIWYF